MDLSSIFNLPPLPHHPTPTEQPFFPAAVPPSQPPPAVVPQPKSNNSPVYAEMIFAAIQALNERDGSSKQAISRYISAAYPDLPPAHDVLLDKAITNLKKTGHLVLVKKSYKLPVSEPVAPPVLPPESEPGMSGKRGRGRPKKVQPPEVDGSEVEGAALPPWISAADATLMSLGLVEEPEPPKTDAPSGKRGRGRPKKSGSPANELAVGAPAVSGSGKRGRPKKNVEAVTADNGTVDSVAGEVKRGRGRPKKIEEGNVAADATIHALAVKKRGRGRPRVKTTGGTMFRYVGRKRGRPRKVDGSSDSGGAVAAGKKRGRPPGRKNSGRPVGRPRKNPLTGSSSGAPASSYFTEENVLRKFDFMRTKIRDALTTLRPLSSSSMTAMNAIQELDGIASMEYSAMPLAPITVEPDSAAPRLLIDKT